MVRTDRSTNSVMGLRVLLAGDDSGVFRGALEALSESFRLEHRRAANLAELHGALQDGEWDVLLCDPGSATCACREVLALVAETGSDLMVVAVSEREEEASAAELIAAGARAVLDPARFGRLAPIVRRELEDIRRRRLRELQALLQFSPDPMLVAQADGRIRHVNRLLVELLGYSASELEGQPVELLVPEHLRARHVADRARYAAAPAPRLMAAGVELAVRHKDGTQIPVEISLGPVRLGEEQLICCGLRDLRERVRAERLLRAILEGTAEETGEEFLRALVKNLARALEVRYAFVGEFVAAERARVLAFWNGEGYTDPFVYPLAGTPCARVNAEGECVVREHAQQAFPDDPGLRKAGVESYFGVRIQSKAGAPLGLLSVMDARPLANEITARTVMRIFAASAGAELERMRITARLRESEQRFASAFNATPLSTLISRRDDGLLLEVNEAFCAYTGYRREEALGRSALELGLWPDAGERERAVEILKSEGSVRAFPSHLRLRSGEIRDVLRWMQPLEIGGEPCMISVAHDVTEARLAEQKLRASEEQFRVIFERAPVGMALRGLDGRWLDANPKLCEILGYTREELRSKTSVEITPEEERDEARRYNERMRRGELSRYAREKRYLRKDGTPVWVNLTVNVVQGPEGKPHHLVSVIEDISERKQAEAVIREHERVRETLLNNLPGMVYRCRNDPQWTVEFASRGCLELTGYEPDDLVGNRTLAYADIMDPQDRERVWDEVQAAIGERRPFELRYRIRARDGATKWVWERGRGVFSESGELLALEGYITDVTLQVSAEQARRESEAELRLLTDSLPAMICYIGKDYRYRYANRRYAEFHTGSPEPVEGRTLEEVIGRDVWLEARPRLERALTGETVTDSMKRRRRSDGSLRDLDISLVPHRDEAGHVQGVYVLILDVTRRRRAEERLRLRERALESSVNSVIITRPTEKGQEIVYVNPAFEKITGYPAGEVIGRSPRFLHGDDRAQPGIEALRAAAKEGRETTALVRNYRKDGSLFWNELRVAPVRDDAGRVTHFVGISSDVTERVRYQEEIERSANYDSLTGLPNRNLLRDRLEQALAKSRRSERPVGVLYVDLDNLKRINDSLGHAMGDRVIAAIGARLAGAVRTGDTVARVGGDEFVVVLADLKREDDAALVAGKMLNFVGTPLKVESHEFVLSASAGVALYPKDGGDAATLLRNADTALYRAKAEGRDCFRFFAAEMNERVVGYMRLEQDLRRALELDEFQLQYQPIVRLASGEAVGAEALIRWRRSDGRMVSPAEFIPVAEESGLIVPIGRWVLETAARQAAAWNRGRRAPLYVSVNLSARQFRDPKLLETVQAALAAARLDPALLKLEITETAVMQDVEGTERWLGALKHLGVRLSVDDFGTGYSSLAYLKRFPIDTLKIDRSFVSGLPDDGDDVAICRAVIDLGRRLELEVLAEGVETRAQAGILALHGCDLAQGYLFGKPVDPEDFAAAILRGGGRKPWRAGPTPTNRTSKRTRRTTRR